MLHDGKIYHILLGYCIFYLETVIHCFSTFCRKTSNIHTVFGLHLLCGGEDG